MISTIVFSKGRPLQLFAYIESLIYYSGLSESSISVLYREVAGIPYTDIKSFFPQINWVVEQDFYHDLSNLVDESSEYILWGCDDVFFKSSFEPGICAQALANNDQVLAFSLRLGRNIQPIQDLREEYGYFTWDWTASSLIHTGWTYPWEVSASIYRKADVKQVLQLTTDLNNPNLLEGLPATYYFEGKGKFWRKRLACFETSKSITLQINQVQNVYQQNEFEESQETTVEQLYQYFLQGKRLDWKAFENYMNSETHVGLQYFRLHNPTIKKSSVHSDIQLEHGRTLCAALIESGYLFDSRPEFNGEYRLYQWLMTQVPIQTNLFIGARDDFFYMQINPEASYYLFEPDLNAAQELSLFASARLIDCFVNTTPLWSEKSNISFYTGLASCICPKPSAEIQAALQSGLVIDPYLEQMLASGQYELMREEAIQNIAQISVSSFQDLASADTCPYPTKSDFIKLDVEGAEVEILEGMRSILSSSLFVQFEYGSMWFHGNHTFKDVVEVLKDSGLIYFYIILKDKVRKVHPESMEQYFFCNILASRFDFGFEQLTHHEPKLRQQDAHNSERNSEECIVIF